MPSALKKVNDFHKRVFLARGSLSDMQGEGGHTTEGGEGTGDRASFFGRTGSITITFGGSFQIFHLDVIENAIMAEILVLLAFFSAFPLFLALSKKPLFFFFVLSLLLLLLLLLLRELLSLW